MLSSIVFYNLILFISLISLHVSNNSKYKITFSFLAFFLLFVTLAIRVNIGTDYLNYEDTFNIINLGGGDITTEPLFYIINIFSSKLGFGFRGVIIITSLLFVIPLLKCLDRQISIWIVFFILINYYLFSFNAIRQGVALSISCYAAYKFIYLNDSKFKYITLILIATGFHYSALIGLFLIPARKILLPLWISISLILFFYFFGDVIKSGVLTSDVFLTSKYAFYAQTNYIDGAVLGSGIGFFLQVMPFFIILLFSKYIFSDYCMRNMASNVSLIYLLVKILILHMEIFYRVEQALFFMFAFIFAELVRCRKKNYINFLLFLYLVFWNVFSFESQLLNNANEVIPYQSLIGSL